MNRYVLVPTVYLTPFATVLQVLDTEEGMPTTFPEGGGEWVDATGNMNVQVGWKAVNTYINGWLFTEPTYEEYVSLATSNMQQRFNALTRRLTFNPLQYKVDLGVATSAEEAALIAYKQYAIAVSDIVSQSGYPSSINWPVAPF